MKVIMKRMEDMGLNIGSESTMRNLIKDLGFRWQKTEDNNKILMESYDIRIKRIKYLKQLFIYREQAGHNIIGQSVNELMSLTTKAFDEVTIENWTAVCAQVHKLEQDYKNQEQVIDYSLDSLVFAVNTDSSDEDNIKSEPSDDDMDVGDFI
ncbi:hypothetical protein RN001_006074 [Aquatica leii]|uniref:Uncharacterized protein n=1 Tax=Aquatica leii TaxID=1421715 RepID=A0AAN7Q8J4_9COLE|nr:hypothetical protein RN001_006074 [Aquatica leii]